MSNILLEEIHACLGAGEFAHAKDGTPAYMHLARKIDLIAKALGIAFELDGSIISLRQSKHIPSGGTIPAGWSIGQFGRNNGKDKKGQPGGEKEEERLGIAYKVCGNKFSKNPSSGEEIIENGGYILCESIPQLLAILMQDLDRSLGLQTLGSFAIANPNYNPNQTKLYPGAEKSMGPKYFKYNGLGQALIDMIYALMDTNKQASMANIGSLKSQAVSHEILGALGVPSTYKQIQVLVDGQTTTVVYPGFNGDGSTLVDILMWILMNLAVINDGGNK